MTTNVMALNKRNLLFHSLGNQMFKINLLAGLPLPGWFQKEILSCLFNSGGLGVCLCLHKAVFPLLYVSSPFLTQTPVIGFRAIPSIQDNFICRSLTNYICKGPIFK